LLFRIDPLAGTGIVDTDSQLAPFLHHCIDHRRHRLFFGDIGCDGNGIDALLCQLVGNAFGALANQIGHCHCCARFAQGMRIATPNARTRACYQCGSPIQTKSVKN